MHIYGNVLSYIIQYNRPLNVDETRTGTRLEHQARLKYTLITVPTNLLLGMIWYGRCGKVIHCVGFVNPYFMTLNVAQNKEVGMALPFIPILNTSYYL